MSRTSGARTRLAIVVLLLAALHFAIRPRLGDPRYAPDFILIALLLVAIRTRPGVGAVAGLCVGIVTDALAPTAFGAAALAHTVVGYTAGWLTMFVPEENVAMTALFVLAAAWLRDLIQVLASNQLGGAALLWQIFGTSVVASLATAAVAAVLLYALRGVLAPARA